MCRLHACFRRKSTRGIDVQGNAMAGSVNYDWQPPAQQVGDDATADIAVPQGYIHQTAEALGGGPDIQGVYAEPVSGWESVVWRWADTKRFSIQRIPRPEGVPTYRMEIEPTDGASSGTHGDAPRAELYSVDAGEKRRDRPVSPGIILRDGDEYWATFAVYIPSSFPMNHKWATLFQRKFDDREALPDAQGQYHYLSWFGVNVHGAELDAGIPGRKTQGDYSAAFATLDPQAPGNLPPVADQWTQFVVHEKLSSGNDGLAELYVNGSHVPVVSGQPTVRAGDINHHFQYGYYRSNDPRTGDVRGPGLGVLYYTPLLIKRGSAQASDAPKLP